MLSVPEGRVHRRVAMITRPRLAVAAAMQVTATTTSPALTAGSLTFQLSRAGRRRLWLPSPKGSETVAGCCVESQLDLPAPRGRLGRDAEGGEEGEVVGLVHAVTAGAAGAGGADAEGIDRDHNRAGVAEDGAAGVTEAGAALVHDAIVVGELRGDALARSEHAVEVDQHLIGLAAGIAPERRLGPAGLQPITDRGVVLGALDSDQLVEEARRRKPAIGREAHRGCQLEH